MKKIDKRLMDLEQASGVKDEGVCIQYPDEPMVKICMPTSRSGEEISRADFDDQYPDGLIIRVVGV